jgi:hypothetical protein
VSTPQASHTVMISPGVARWLAISEGCTKIEAPMMVPATIAIAFTRVNAGFSSDKTARA